MTIVKTKFKSSATEKRWVELQKEKVRLQAQKETPAVKKKIEDINSFMTACKVGFDLTEAKVKKIIKFLKEKTGVEKVKYGILPAESVHHAILYKDIVVSYSEKEGQVFFREVSSQK